jgi:RNA polymerase sigma-70 factor (ECF subfamily)
MLTEDATWSMPPVPTWYRGQAAVREWLVRSPLTERWRHWPGRANGQVAVGCYLFDDAKGRYTPAVIDVLTMAGDKIAAVTGFLVFDVATRPDGTPVTSAEIFGWFGLPPELD